MNIYIRPPDVDMAAQTISNAVQTATEQVTRALAPSMDAATANQGWQCSPALTECATAWQDHLTDLIQRTEAAAKNLYDSAGHYREVERRVANALTDLHP